MTAPNSGISSQIEQLIEDLPERDLVFRFTATFSRIEFALKKNGFVCGQDAKPNWDRFARETSDLYECADTETRAAIDALFSDPPRKQVFRDGYLDWEKCEPTSRDNASLLVLVRRIRNNVFHGGKFPFNIDRDAALLRNALIVLKATIALTRDDVRGSFLNNDARATF
jgi:hypothetical protein